jgi:RNA polymerase sigma factor (sigma-70 family)
MSAAASVSYPTRAVLKGVGLGKGEPHPAADFELLYERFRLPLYRFVRGMVLDAEAAEELTRRAFDRAYSARGRFGGEISTAAWLHGFALRLSMSHLRRRRLAAFVTGRRAAPGAWDGDPDYGAVEMALAALSPALRSVALLGLYAKLPSEEVASILGISEETVSSRLRTAVDVMTATLSAHRPAEATGGR